MQRTIAQINDKIRQQQAQVCTVKELKARVADQGVKAVAEAVDVITTGTFEPMESTGAVLNLGHTDPPIKIRQCWLDGVPAYAGLGAVDVYLGATMPAETREGELEERGGGHVLEKLIAGKPVQLRAIGQATDCYPRSALETTISRDTINQFYLSNPRNLYQNFVVGVNGSDRLLHTYLGPLHPNLGNAVYAHPGALSPLLNDPDLELIGIGTKIFLGGGVGYITGEGTQHFPLQRRLENRTPIGPAATIAVTGDAKQMHPDWVRGCYFKQYGPSVMLGVGIPLPVLDEVMVARCAVSDAEIVAPVMDFSIPRRIRPSFGLVTYEQLKQGSIQIEGQTVRTAPLASFYRADQVAELLKQWIVAGEFTLTEAVAPLPRERAFLAQDGMG
ncbi:MAG: hypothetical protein F6J87_09910 [Spirulina sp. SIO3F2]|nr:hypothetical protein [Spirulina sp. SIO3F2]